MGYFFSWCINQIVSGICLMMVFFFSIYTCLSVANHGFMYYRTWTLCTNMRIAWNICSHAEKMSFSAMSTSYAVKNECFFCNAGFILRYHLLIATWCALESKVSTSEFNLMCVGVELDVKNFQTIFLISIGFARSPIDT